MWYKITRAKGSKEARQGCEQVWMGRPEKTWNEALREGRKQSIWLSGAKATLGETTLLEERVPEAGPELGGSDMLGQASRGPLIFEDVDLYSE